MTKTEWLGDAVERAVTTPRRGRDPVLWLLALYALVLPNDTLFVPVANVSLGRVAGVVLVTAWAASVFLRRQAPRVGVTQYALAALALWHLVALLWTSDASATLRLAATAIQLMVLALVVHDRIRTADEARFVLSGFLTGCLIAAIDVATQMATNVSEISAVRYAATGFDVNEFGGVIVIGAGAAFVVLSMAAGSSQRILATAFLVVAPLLLFATGSRGSLVAAIPAALGVGWMVLRSSRRPLLLVLAGGSVAAVFAFSLVQSSTAERYEEWLQSPLASDASASDRVDLAKRAVDVFGDHPILGVGPGALPPMTRDINGRALDAHNTPLDVAAEQGVVGLALLGIAVLAPVPQLARRRERWSTASLVLLGGVLMQSMSLSLEHSKHFWFAVTLCAALAASTAASNPALRE
ncbi:MAG: O-antigen ligase family protein [Acidimicrobiales bacterium]